MGHKNNLNRSYRIVWSESRQTWVAASELAKGHSRASCKSVKQLVLAVVAGTILAGQLTQPVLAQSFTPVVSGMVSGETITSGTQSVISGGVANGGAINIGGVQNVSNGGSANNIAVNSGGRQNVYAGGVTSSIAVNTGGQQRVSGGTAEGTTLSGVFNSSDSGFQYVYAGGVANNTIINSGGDQRLYSGATANSSVLNSGGIQRVSSGGTAVGTVFNGGGQYVYDGAVVSGAHVVSGGQTVSAGGAVVGTILETNGRQNVWAGGIVSDTVFNGGWQYLYNGATVSGANIVSGGQTINSGGTAVSSILTSGAIQYISAGGNAVDTVFSGGRQYLYGAVVSGAQIDDGTQIVSAGGSAVGTTLGSSGRQNVFAGGSAIGTVFDGGGQYIYDGAVVSGAQIANGEQRVNSGGSAADTRLNGGTQYVYDGGLASNAVIEDGGRQIISSGGQATSAIVNNNGRQYVSAGAVATGTIVNSGARQDIYSTGVALDTTVNAGGVQRVSAGGSAVDTVIDAGGIQTISSGGFATDTDIAAGGLQNISSGGSADNTIIHSAGVQRVYSGAVAVDTTIDNSGAQYVYGGGVAVNTTVNTGGILNISDGGILEGFTLVVGDAQLNASTTFVNNGVLTLNQTADNTLAATISGAGSLVKDGNNTLILTGVNSYTGGTTVAGGSLYIGDIAGSPARLASDVNVQNGAILGGHGQIAGHVTVDSGGTLSPGTGAVGTLTTGQVILKGGSILDVDAHPDHNVGRVVADSALGGGNGTVTIEPGAALQIWGGAGTWAEKFSYVIVDSDQGVSGQFSTVDSNLAFLTSLVDYSNPDQVRLTLVRNNTSFPSVGGSENQQNTGAGIEGLGENNPIYETIVSMDAWQARNAFDSLSGEIHASVKSALLINSRYPRLAIMQHLSDASGLLASETDINKNLWVNVWAHDGHVKADGNASKLDNRGLGVLIGSDLYASADETTVFGVAAGYEHTKLSTDRLRHSDADINAIHLLAYGRTSVGLIDLKGGIGYSWLDIDTERNIAIGNLVSKNQGNYNGGLLQAFIQGSHTFNLTPNLNLTPYINVAAQRITTDSFTETGGLTILHSSRHSDNLLTTTIGVKSEWQVEDRVSLYGDLGWQYNVGSIAPKVHMNFVGGKEYTIRGVEINRNAAVVGVGANFQLQPNMTLSIGYDGEFGRQVRDHAARIMWEFKF